MIVQIDRKTKIQYSLFNFFAPISLFAVMASGFKQYSASTSLMAFLSIAIGLFCLIFNLKRYNKYLNINEESIAICTGDKKMPKVVKIIKLFNQKINIAFQIKNENKYISLLHTSPSIIGLICYVGPLIFILIFKKNNVTSNKLSEIKKQFPDLVDGEIKKPTKADNILTEILMWGLVLFVSLVGMFGIFLAPLYPFMNG